MEQNADLTFQEFFAELQKLYDRDSVAQQRMAWQAVKLPSGELTLYKWLDFLLEFQLKKSRVDDRTPQEEHKLLMDNLPTFWTRKVFEEEVKRRRGSHLVRMTNAPPKSPTDLQKDLQNALGCQVSRVEAVNNGFVIHCPTESIQQLVLGMQGWSLDGQTIKVSRMEATMSVEEIGAFITEKLEIDHAVQVSKQQQGLVTKEVQEVSSKPNSPEQDPPPPHGGRGTGGGRGAGYGGRASWKGNQKNQGKGANNSGKGKGEHGKGNFSHANVQTPQSPQTHYGKGGKGKNYQSSGKSWW